MLDASWQLKKQMASAVSNGQFDLIYERALDAGAEGGKIAGAGGGGCLLLVVPPPRRASVRRTMQAAGLREVPVGMEIEGSRIIHYSS
jgi:D-glycero-alpha-D-manno-heptose-7-phosphate kinase